jgi:hypothetical protein
MLMLGPKVPGTNVANDFYSKGEQVYLDELALFNHSLRFPPAKAMRLRTSA